jgi:type III restriction enzyme
MELKQFQRDVIDNLSRFLTLLQQTGDISKSFRIFWEERGVCVGCDGGMENYKHLMPNVPNVCLKVPTGGGKTFIAASAIKVIFDSIGETKYIKNKTVAWLVPSDSTLEQTLKNLSNTSHPYRQRIDADFGSRVEVYSKEQLLSGHKFNPTAVGEQLSIFVLSYDSFRISFVSALHLKRENMVKLPVIVSNHKTQTDVFTDAIKLRVHLEAEAKREKKQSGRYIRPIVLFQAQPPNYVEDLEIEPMEHGGDRPI